MKERIGVQVVGVNTEEAREYVIDFLVANYLQGWQQAAENGASADAIRTAMFHVMAQ